MLHSGHLLPIAFVEDDEDLFEAFGAELLYPTEWIVRQRDPERLDARVDLVDAQVRLGQVLYVVSWLVELVSTVLDATLVVQNQHLLLLSLGLLTQRFLLLLRQVHVCL